MRNSIRKFVFNVNKDKEEETINGQKDIQCLHIKGKFRALKNV